MTPDRGKAETYSPGGLSILELLVTLVIIALVVTAVTGVMYQTTRQIEQLRSLGQQQGTVQNCLDLILDDIMRFSGLPMDLSVEREMTQMGEMSHLIITSIPDPSRRGAPAPGRVDWISAARMEEGDMVLFRREQKPEPGVASPALFVPLCENLSSFAVNLCDENGEPTEDKEKVRLIEIEAQVFRDQQRDPERVFHFRRMFCWQRFQQ